MSFHLASAYVDERLPCMQGPCAGKPLARPSERRVWTLRPLRHWTTLIKAKSRSLRLRVSQICSSSSANRCTLNADELATKPAAVLSLCATYFFCKEDRQGKGGFHHTSNENLDVSTTYPSNATTLVEKRDRCLSLASSDNRTRPAVSSAPYNGAAVLCSCRDLGACCDSFPLA
jgi:hypothetical protein